MNALNVLCAQLTRDLFAIAKFLFLHSIICLARARTSEPAAVRDQVFDKKSGKLVGSVSQTRTNLSKTWLQSWSITRFAARFAAG